jgi:hypothetical protein
LDLIEKSLREYKYQKVSEFTSSLTKFMYELLKLTRKSAPIEQVISVPVETSEEAIDEMNKSLQGKNIFSVMSQIGNKTDVVNRNVLMQQDRHYQKMLQ